MGAVVMGLMFAVFGGSEGACVWDPGGDWICL